MTTLHNITHPDNTSDAEKSHSDDDFDHQTQDQNKIQKFICNNLDDILDIYYDFKDRFSFNPYFLGLCKPTDLSDFFAMCLYNNGESPRSASSASRTLQERFQTEYSNELSTSYYIVATFLEQFDHVLIPLVWIRFCIKHSDLCEMRNGSQII